ncbi:Mov34/MPN/PAD-1 family protein [Paenibacillus periandrae]|uniref:Mov34/MPN/PAD-1 family protein n=1 Tax=Paenibacillus periandrae TaxID=1761741 RepID=UPI001F09C6ED|nr:M67 family metallopeptidase [Paenibacillus periandrae]
MYTLIQLTKSVQETIISHCMANKPKEACGFLLGSVHLTQIRVTSFVPVANASTKPENQFSMHPSDMIPVISNNTFTIVGILHSHPSAAATPSSEDLSTIWYDIPSHWIVSLQQPVIEIVAYRYTYNNHSLVQAQYHPIPIMLIGDD